MRRQNADLLVAVSTREKHSLRARLWLNLFYASLVAFSSPLLDGPRLLHPFRLTFVGFTSTLAAAYNFDIIGSRRSTVSHSNWRSGRIYHYLLRILRQGRSSEA